MRRIPPAAPVVTATEMRAAEQGAFDAGVSAAELMERAGLEVARQVRRLAAGRPILIAAGPGNNGGDGYVAARHLAGWGLDVVVAALAPTRTDPARGMADLWHGPTAALHEAAGRPVLVDSLFGTGSNRPLSDDLRDQFLRLSDAAELVIAIDLPSGVDANGAQKAGALHADVTIALGALKIAHVVGPQSEKSGHVILADLGIAVRSSRTTIARPKLKPLRHDANKFTRGMVVVVGGTMPGASALAASSAMHGGAGYVVLAEGASSGTTPRALVRRSIADADALAAILDDDRVGAVVIGPGLGRDERARALLDAALGSRRNFVIDGDALSLLGRDVAHRVNTGDRAVFLTPHEGEFDRLFASGGTKVDRTVAAAAATGATVVHKGFDTVIARPDGTVTIAAGMTPWLSTAGSGDVLAGLLAARVATHPRDGARVDEAVWLHARAGALCGPSFIADDMVARIPQAMGECTPI